MLAGDVESNPGPYTNYGKDLHWSSDQALQDTKLLTDPSGIPYQTW